MPYAKSALTIKNELTDAMEQSAQRLEDLVASHPVPDAEFAGHLGQIANGHLAQMNAAVGDLAMTVMALAELMGQPDLSAGAGRDFDFSD